MKMLKTAALVGALTVSFVGGVQAAPQYSLTDWGQPTLGYGRVNFVAMNNSNVAVGDAAVGPGTSKAVIYDGTTLTNLGTLGGYSSYARGINDAGVVVGFSTLGNSPARHAFSYYDGAMHDLGTMLPVSTYDSYAYAINSAGTIAGTSNSDTSHRHAAWYDGTIWHDINPSFSEFSDATAINDRGDIAGWARIPGPYGTSETHAFFYDGSMHDLGNITVAGLNNQGLVLGNQLVAGGSSHAVIWDGALRDLGTLAGFAQSVAADINEAGYVVGNLQMAKNTLDTSRAFLYDGETMLDLTTLLAANPDGISLISAIAINDRGNILALGSDYHYYLLQPVPVPAAAWLLGSGLAGLAGLARRRIKPA